MAIYHQDIADIELNSGSLHRSFIGHSIGLGDAAANRFGVRIFRDGVAETLSGVTCQGFFRNANGENIALTSYGTIDGNVAYVTLPQACYNVEGMFTLAIKLVGSGVTGTMRIVDGMVDNTNTGSAVAPTGSVPTYQEVLSVYEQMQTAVTNYDAKVAEQDAEISDLKSAFGNAIANVVESAAPYVISNVTDFVADDWELGGINATGGEFDANYIMRTKHFYPYNPNCTYTWAGRASDATVRWTFLFDSDLNFIARDNSNVIPVRDDVAYLRFAYGYASNSGVTIDSTIMATLAAAFGFIVEPSSEIMAIARNSIGTVSRAEFDRLKSESTNKPYFEIDGTTNRRINIYDGTGNIVQNISGASDVLKCPNYMAVRFLTASARMYFYIGDMVNGGFVPDLENYLFNVTSQGHANYINSSHGRILHTEGKYFQYRKAVDEDNIEIIGFDSYPNFDSNLYTKTSYFCTSAGVSAEGNKRYYGYVIPAGCYFMVDADPSMFDVVRLSIPVKSADTIGYEILGYGRTTFGNVGEADGFGLLTIGCSNTSIVPDFSQVRVYVSAESIQFFGFAAEMDALVKGIREKEWVCKKRMKWSDLNRYYNVDEVYFAVPYSSRWENSHFVGFEVSLETAYNAANDALSIWYDDTPDRSELGVRGGPGYGLVCSSYASLLLGAMNPQTNFGFTHDGSFGLQPVNSLKPGEVYTNITSHVLAVTAYLKNGFATSEFSGFTALNHLRTSTRKEFRTLRALADKDYGKAYYVQVGYKREKSITDLWGTDFTLANGSIRPWRGNKCVYGQWDKSSRGSGIGVTIHDGASVAYIKKPGGTTVTKSCSGLTYLDIADVVDESGTYELWSDVSNTKEYFRYYDTGAVELTFDENGKCSFDNPDVLYCYASVRGAYGGEYAQLYDTNGSSMTFANGSVYPYLAGHDIGVYAAIIADPAEDSWGCYSVPCNYEFNDASSMDDGEDGNID